MTEVTAAIILASVSAVLGLVALFCSIFAIEEASEIMKREEERK